MMHAHAYQNSVNISESAVAHMMFGGRLPFCPRPALSSLKVLVKVWNPLFFLKRTTSSLGAKFFALPFLIAPTLYNNRPPSAVSVMPAIASTSGRLHSEFVRLLFLQAHVSTGFFYFRRTAFSSGLKRKVVLVLAKAAAFRINLNLDGTPIVSKSHTHPSHSETSRLLTSSLSLGVPVPRPTQCVRGV